MFHSILSPPDAARRIAVLSHTVVGSIHNFHYSGRNSCTSREKGQGLVEYALMLVLVAIIVIGAVTMVGNQTSQAFEEVNCTLAGGTMHTDNGQGNSNNCIPGTRGNGGGNNGGGNNGGGNGGGHP